MIAPAERQLASALHDSRQERRQRRSPGQAQGSTAQTTTHDPVTGCSDITLPRRAGITLVDPSFARSPRTAARDRL